MIEFKLAKSTSLKRNLGKQLEIYLEANKTPHGVKVIISDNNADHLRALKVLDELGLANNRYVTSIDARATNKPSSSVARVPHSAIRRSRSVNPEDSVPQFLCRVRSHSRKLLTRPLPASWPTRPLTGLSASSRPCRRR